MPYSPDHKVMIGFIVRRCAAEIGHMPSAEEFAVWANNREEHGKRYSLFGQAITPSAAKVMLRNMSRLVTIRSNDIVLESPAAR